MAALAMVRSRRRRSEGDAGQLQPVEDSGRRWSHTSFGLQAIGRRVRVPSKNLFSSSRGNAYADTSHNDAPEAPSSPPPAADDPPRRKSLPDVKTPALVLARQFNLDFHEVKFMLQELQSEHEKLGYQGTDLQSFRDCLLRVLGLQEISSHLVQDAYLRCSASDGPINPKHLMAWYRDNIFSLSNKTSSPGERSDDLTLELSKKHQCSCLDLDKVKMQFDSYDLDKSGVIEYGEFELMMRQLLHVSRTSDLPQQRILRFWHELDKDGNGSVDFSEFTEWYLKYFALAQEQGTIEAFYASFSPELQRKSTLQALIQADTCKKKDLPTCPLAAPISWN
mmetsp:Transcript_52585/g.117892  ORF Transcript_52585/g.117892 Transcript_52585/m.117892 type:complete len:336 (-) Transcript_52585:12-1019(-)